MTRRFRYCPVCRDEMERDVVGSVLIEACPKHGTWFDAGELRTFAEHNGAYALWEDTVQEEFEPSAGGPTSCPGCHSWSLEAGVVRAFALSLCAQCYGLFLPLHSVERLTEMFPLRVATGAENVVTVLGALQREALLNALKRLIR